MNATIDKNGRLTIQVTNDIEDYALSQWWDNWNADNERVTLSVAYSITEGRPQADKRD